MPIAEADDLGGKLLTVHRVDADAAAHAQFAHRADDFEQQPLHRLDAAEHLDVVDGLDRRDQRLHSASGPCPNYGFRGRSNRCEQRITR